MASKRQIWVGGVPIGGGAPVVVQSMTKTDTSDVEATLEQIGRMVDAGCELVRVAVPRDKDAVALETIVKRSPVPVIADIHFNHTLALKAIDAGAHCIRLNPGNIGGREKVAEVARARDRGRRADADRRQLRLAAASTCTSSSASDPVEALVTAAVEFVELMEGLDFENFKVSIKSTSVPNTIAANRLLAQRIDYPLHLGVTESGTRWSGSLKSAVGLGTLLAEGVGDTIRISLSTFQAEEEVKVAWEILKALQLRERGPVLIACPTCGRLQFDMDTVVAEIERRLERYDAADRGRRARLRRERDRRGLARGLRHHRRQERGHDLRPRQAAAEGAAGPPRGRAVRRDRQVAGARAGCEADERKAAEAADWLEQIERENAGELTPERIAADGGGADARRRRGGARREPEPEAVAGPPLQPRPGLATADAG